MDWSKTKTIFIIVFSVLNALLYFMYLNRNADIQNVEVTGKTSIEDVLRQEKITYKLPPFIDKEASFISADLVDFKKEPFKKLTGQKATISGDNALTSILTDKVMVEEAKKDDFQSFLSQYVINGNEYVLWEINEDQKNAFFFQQFEGRPIYFSPNAMLTVSWNDKKEIVQYEQRMLKDFSPFNKKDLLSPLEIIGTLASRGLLKPESKVTDVKMGYSTLVRLTETQVFAPTWDVQVKLKDGEMEHHFLSANEGKVIEFQLDTEIPDLEEGLE